MQGYVPRIPALPANLEYSFLATQITRKTFSSYHLTSCYRQYITLLEMIKRLIHLLLILAVLVPAFASSPAHKEGRRQMKIIKEQLKNRKGSDALKSVENLRKDSVYLWNPQLLQYGVEACKILNDKENEKFYLKSKPDTAAFFNTTYNLINYILLTDSAERMPVVIGDTADATKIGMQEPSKYRFRKQNKDELVHSCKNFIASTKFFSANGQWEDTQKFTGLAIDLANSPIMGSYKRPLIEPATVNELAILNVNACYRQKKYDDVEKYAYYALRDSANEESVCEKLAYCAIERGDSVTYRKWLEKGHTKYPSNMFFFSRLVDVYLHNSENEAVLTAANQTLEYVLEMAQDEATLCVIDTTGTFDQLDDAQALHGVRSSVALPANDIAQVFEARAIAYHNNGNPRACIENAENILNWNPYHPRADFFIGASYYSMAESVVIPSRVNDPNYQKATRERNRLLTLGRPHLEAYRRNAPDDTSNWAPLLYETYLYLNLGPEFEEISHFIH